MKFGKRLLCLTLALLLAVSVLPISALAATSEEDAVAKAYEAIKDAIIDPEDGVNAALNGLEFNGDQVTVAELTYSEEKEGEIDCKFVTPDFPAMNLLTVPFLSRLFGYKEIKSIYFVGLPEESSGFVTNPLELTGNNDQMFIMLGVLAAFRSKYPTRMPDSLSNTTPVSLLDGSKVSVELNGQTEDGTSYKVPVTVYFYSETHNVEFRGGNIASEHTEKKGVGEAITFPDAKQDYKVTGWEKTYTDFDGQVKKEAINEVKPNSETMGKFNVVYTALPYTIKFEPDNDDGGQTIQADDNGKVSKPEDPTKTGYKFAGWYTERDGGEQFTDFEKVTESRTLYARWTPETYGVTLNLNDGQLAEDFDSYTYSDDAGTPLPVPTRTGYRFDGWFTDAGFSGGPLEEIEASSTGAKEFFAKWTANQYTVEFKGGDEGVVEGSMTSQSFTYDEDEKPLTENTFTRKGYDFDGWSGDNGQEYTDGQEVRNLTPDKDGKITLTAKWTPKSYQVTLDAAGGKVDGKDKTTITVTYDQTYGDRLTDPAREGYEFVGWQTADGDTVSKETKVGEKLDVTAEGELKLTAMWNPKGDTRYTVKHWLQKVDGEGYELAENGEESKQGQTESEVTLMPREITGFHVNRESSNDLRGTIGANGDTVMNIYYDRNTVEITWQIGEKTERETYLYGAAPSHSGEREDTDHVDYTFEKWVPDLKEVTEAATYTAQYTESHEARIGETTWRTLELALKNAKANDTVVLESDVTLTGDVEVPKDVMLLLPVSADDTGYTETGCNPDGETYSQATGKDPNAELFHRLTVPAGKTVTVNGTVLVNAVTGRPDGGHLDMDVTGGYGEIALEGDIVVKSGGILDVCGYVTGNGTVTAEPGGEVRDLYIVRNWRGGSQALSVYPYVYPMNQVDMHNIEVKTVIEAGARLVGTVKMYAQSRYYYTRFPQIDQDNGLIRQSNGSIVKTYDRNTNREKLVMDGKGSIEASELFIVQLTLTTGDHVYPIDGDMDFELSGDWTVNERLKLMPGVHVLFEEGTFTFAETTAKSKKDMLTAIYDSFQPTDPFTDGTKYPDDRGEASLTLGGGTTTVVNSDFGGKILVAASATKDNPAKLSFASGIRTTVTTDEAEGADGTSNFRTLTFKTTVGGKEAKAGTNYICYVKNGETVVKPSNDVPEIAINYEDETLTGFADGHSFTVNGTNAQPDGGSLAIEEGWFGSDLKIVDVTGGEFLSSQPQTLAVPTRPEAPAGLRGMTPSTPEGTDGSITGLDSGKLYEYKLTDSEKWTDVTAESASITGLSVGTYQVRAKATSDAFLSETAAVEVSYVAPYIPGAPDESKTETVTNPDGSTTTTTTAADGTVTETTEQVDGTVTEKVTEPDGSATQTTTTPEGVIGQVTTDAQGEVTSAEVIIPEDAGKDETVTVPVEVPAAKTSEEAPEISVKTGSNNTTKVEIPVTDIGPGTVAVLVHPDGTEEVVRDCVVGEDGVILNVEGDVTLKIVENSAEFKDIEGVESWAGDAIEFTSARELFSGTGGNNFQPDGDMTRGALVTLLHRLSYEPDAPTTKFSDVDENGIYADAIAWADANSIVTGNGNGLFMPDDNITREQLVTLIYNYAKFRGAVRENTGNINAFSDADKVHDYAREAMAWAIGAGIVSGQGDNTLNPAGITTRAQTAVILMNLCNYMAKY